LSTGGVRTKGVYPGNKRTGRIVEDREIFESRDRNKRGIAFEGRP